MSNAVGPFALLLLQQAGIALALLRWLAQIMMAIPLCRFFCF
jgi:hypothetical protein